MISMSGCTAANSFSTSRIDPKAPPVLLFGPMVPGEPLVTITGVVGVVSDCVVIKLDDGSLVVPYWPSHFDWSSQGTIATIYGEVEIGQQLTATSGNLLDWDEYRAAQPAGGELDPAHEQCASAGARVAPLGTVEEIAGPE